jgi:pyruvate dehydrogenase E2 component (dihydrolipoamide acetyltransferase)
MTKEFKLPDLGEGIHEAQVVNVMIQEGDTVTEDQEVMEVETDKAAVELPVPFSGIVTKLHVKTGDTIIVGQALLSVDDGTAASESDDGTVSGDAPPAAPPPPIEEDLPEYGPGPVPAAPAVRRLARELGIDLRRVRGTGPGGRIVREDVDRHRLAKPAGPSVSAQPPGVAEPVRAPAVAATLAAGDAPQTAARQDPLPDFAQWGPVRREKIPQIRKTIARQMARAWAQIPHVTHGDEVDVTDLEVFRREQGKVFAKQGAKLSLTAFILKAAAGVLNEFPHFIATFDEAAAEIIYKDYVHLGVAVDTPRGLMVPVLRDVDRKGLVAISKELKEIADRAREFKIDVSEFRGGTFTVTNVGALGGTFSTPMINYPEVAVLGMGKLHEKPVVRDGEIVVRKILPLFVSFDHRVIDGADGARFVQAIAMFLENPLNLLLVS